MKAIRRHEYGTPDVLELVDVDRPTPLANEVLVRVMAAGVNMADVDYLTGYPNFARLGTGLRTPKNNALGLDLAGEVVSIGKDVTRFKAGDEIFGDLTDYGFGSFAEFVCAPEVAFAPKPSNLSMEEAAVVPQAGVMGLQGMRYKRTTKPGDKVLVNGAGGNVGPFAVQVAKSLGAEVTGVDSAGKLEMLQAIGADHVIDYEQEDFTRNGQRYDRILDVAAFHTISDYQRVMASGGVYASIPATLGGVWRGMIVGPLRSIPSRRKMGMLPWKPFDLDDVAYLTQLIEAGKVKPVIDRRYPLAGVPDALRYQASGQPSGKIVITI
jgi:NADPH:quinone reductase-like Zn-dependent oxidoreductase